MSRVSKGGSTDLENDSFHAIAVGSVRLPRHTGNYIEPVAPDGNDQNVETSGRLGTSKTHCAVSTPLTLFSGATRGEGEASKGRGGGIGNGILCRFTLTLDFTHSQAYLEPNNHLGEVTSSGRCRCGWVFDTTNTTDGHRITAIVTGSAAEAAGLRVGDILTTVADQPAPAMGFAGMFDNDRTHRLHTRGGAAFTIDFRARQIQRRFPIYLPRCCLTASVTNFSQVGTRARLVKTS
ncbi:MAG: hypothetical protein H7145_05675 [Akkermansiaceae bacterium]|nr:hypothetical protein [Armatimonadota bacterium]